MSLKTYQQTQAAAETPRQTEYRLFATVTHGLIAARDSGLRDKSFNQALDLNRQFWSVLATDCGVQGNGLPDALRAGIISLSIWVSKHTSQVMRGKDNDIDALIDINRSIMEGLATAAEALGAPVEAEGAKRRSGANDDNAEGGPPGKPGSFETSV